MPELQMVSMQSPRTDPITDNDKDLVIVMLVFSLSFDLLSILFTSIFDRKILTTLSSVACARKLDNTYLKKALPSNKPHP